MVGGGGGGGGMSFWSSDLVYVLYLSLLWYMYSNHFVYMYVPTHKRRRYNVASFIGCVYAQNDTYK